MNHVKLDQRLLIHDLIKLVLVNLLLVLISIDLYDDLYPRICVANKVKNMNVKVYDLILEINKTRFLVQHVSENVD